MKFCADLEDFDDFDALTVEIERFSSFGIRPGLKRISRLLRLLGNPEKGMSAIQILGTNGKGSSAAVMDAMLTAAGMKTALYTSPHLISLQERLRLSGCYAPFSDWNAHWRKIVRAVESDAELRADKPSFFEHFTALALSIIREARADVLILEAGMGGRYDATSVCDPAAVMINPIGMDHTQYLGDTPEAIAGEKFAAAKNGKDAFYAGDDERLTGLFAEYCRDIGALPHLLDSLARPEDIRCGVEGTFFSYRVLDPEALGTRDISGLKTPLPGRHQAFNAARAITVLLYLKKHASLFPTLNEEIIRRGLARTDWPGRMEIIRGADGQMIMLDGAHNEHGARALVSSLQNLEHDGEKVKVGALVFAVMSDKDFIPILNVLKELDCPMFCAQLPLERSLRASELARHAKASGLAVAGVFENPADALESALAKTDGLTVCCGSLYLVGYLEREMKYKQGISKNPFSDRFQYYESSIYQSCISQKRDFRGPQQ
ncbi:MAG: bifunctional folylpolyglutamate synthase/dihydrofolate synthase [Synergistaceae bacterium]|jgi:dihydrofolate synthase/folylpolyglutamate synthase|nr:bifunctional folylpolyglutamate synthase/dihydrofolate synthase [Synergistaceae bacterium]